MTEKQNLHGAAPASLSDEQFCELLMEHASAADTAEVAQVKNALASYREESLLWAERRSAAQPSLAAAARRSRMWAAAPQWSLAAVVLMTATVGVLHFNGRAVDNTVSVQEPVRVAGQTANPQQQIADDNALLQSIDTALNSETNLPVNALGLDVPHEDVQQSGKTE